MDNATLGESQSAFQAVIPVNAFLVVADDGKAEIVFQSPDGRIVGKDLKYNEAFVEKVKAQILRAKLAGPAIQEDWSRGK